MGFKVMSKRCNQCLMTPNKIVSDERRDELLREMKDTDNHFICHKATIAGCEVACRGHFEETGGGKIGRMAKFFNLIEFVDESTFTDGES